MLTQVNQSAPNSINLVICFYDRCWNDFLNFLVAPTRLLPSSERIYQMFPLHAINFLSASRKGSVCKELGISKWVARPGIQVNITLYLFSSLLFCQMIKGPNSLTPQCVNRGCLSLSNGSSAIFGSLSFPFKLLHVTHRQMKPHVIELVLTIQKPEFWISFNVIPFPEFPVFLWHNYTASFDT